MRRSITISIKKRLLDKCRYYSLLLNDWQKWNINYPQLHLDSWNYDLPINFLTYAQKRQDKDYNHIADNVH